MLLDLKRTYWTTTGNPPTEVPQTSPNPIGATSFSYDPYSYTATWTFPNLAEGKYSIHLNAPSGSQAGIVDIGGNALDSNWVNPSGDLFENDLRRTFADGDGTAGSINNVFRFHFALLAGDYNGDGRVTTDDAPVFGGPLPFNDGNGDGSISTATDGPDIGVRTTQLGKKLPLLRYLGADLVDDEIVDAGDLAQWRANYASNPTLGDVDGDGQVNGDDLLIWQVRLGNLSTWYIDDSDATQAVVGAFAPWITNVIVSGSQSAHAAFSFNTVDGSGQQLRTVPVGASDTITIAFSEAVNVNANNLMLLGLRTANIPTLVAFSYDAGTNSATWRFEGWALGDQYLLVLRDCVTDVEGNRLDGEWTNPNRIYQTGTSGAYFQDAAINEFPSGDGEPGGWFTFLITLLPGDATQNGIIDSQDWSLLGANMGPGPGKLFTQGDFNGDGAVNSTDVNYFYNPAVSNLPVFKVKADLNNDGVVNDYDLNIIGLHAGMTGATLADGDVNGDGSVTQADLDLALAQYGPWWDWVDMVA